MPAGDHRPAGHGRRRVRGRDPGPGRAVGRAVRRGPAAVSAGRAAGGVPRRCPGTRRRSAGGRESRWSSGSPRKPRSSTATSITNEYHWGDLKGSPDQMMQRYYDAHLYLGNWGTHRIVLWRPGARAPITSCQSGYVRDIPRGPDGGVRIHSSDEPGANPLSPTRHAVLTGEARTPRTG